jgi:hypothetical protein
MYRPSSFRKPAGLLQGFKAVAVHALILRGADHPLHHPVLLRAVGRDEFLRQAIAFVQCGLTPAGKYEAVV